LDEQSEHHNEKGVIFQLRQPDMRPWPLDWRWRPPAASLISRAAL
jgi:hypothetical protein